MYVQGEVLSSLILRYIEIPDTSMVSEFGRLMLQEIMQSAIANGDIDFDYAEDKLRCVSESLEIELSLLASINRAPSWGLLLAPCERVQFCPSCIREDLKSIRFPVWRLNWGYAHYTVCDIHLCPLQVLKGEYRCNNPLYRINSVGRYILDHPSEAVGPSYSGEVGRLLSIMAVVANKIQDQLCAWREQSMTERSNLFFGLFSAVLRAYMKPVDAPPYCYQLSKSLLRENVAPVANHGSAVGDLFFGHTRATSVTARMIGLVMTAVILDVSSARADWQNIVALFADIGVLVPNNPTWLFTTCTGTADQGVRGWLTSSNGEKLNLPHFLLEDLTLP
ncbi:TniQ family protein [Pseudomonas sp. W2-17]|uniref:TniQ family protein n=1 Tax=unclassified Pseudomonas TaxID=196821 RepID=UPI0034E0D5BA